MSDRKIAEAFPPGDFMKEELEARGWSQLELAEIIGCHPKVVNDLILGRREISPQIAKALAQAFDTSAEYWANLESSYQLWRAGEVDNAIARRARLYGMAPIKEMVKRRWLEPSESVDVLEKRVKEFFRIKSLDAPVSFPHAARRGMSEITASQTAWLFRARQLAHAVSAKPFSSQSFERGLRDLKTLLLSAAEARNVPRVLADAGIRFLVVEHLPQTRIDGVTFWLDTKSPVIAVSLRYDRIDWFWYTLAHELGHVERRDGLQRVVTLDTDIVGEDAEPAIDDAERKAAAFATRFLLDQAKLEDFILRVRPLYSKQRIIAFAQTAGVHPGIVVGQLQFREEILWSSCRQMLERVRDTVIQSALTDGWGHILPVVS